MPPIPRPFPRFIADSPQEGRPYGRWAERLDRGVREGLRAATRARPGAPLDPETVQVVSRAELGRARLRAGDRAGQRRAAARPRTASRPRARSGRVLRLGLLRAPRGRRARRAARPAPTSPTSPPRTTRDWKIDLSDDVIGAWRAEGERGGDITLVWGLPLVRGAVAATAELDGEVLDQAAVQDGRFTLVAVDAVARLRRRPLPRGQALGPHPARDRRREPLRRGRLIDTLPG